METAGKPDGSWTRLHFALAVLLLAAQAALAQGLSATAASAQPGPAHPYLLGVQVRLGRARYLIEESVPARRLVVTVGQLADAAATGLFARAGMSRGGVESLSFAECDAAVSLGAQLSGSRWGRGDDGVGLAVGVELASPSHREYLAAGGAGLRLGDGGLRFGPEIDSEAYYAFAIAKALALTADVQAIVNPGFNRDRGPVVLLALRAHLEL